MLKMILAIIPHDHAETVLDALITANHTATFTESRGGMLRQAQKMLYIVVDSAELETVLTIIRDNCRTSRSDNNTGSVTAGVGGAIVFVSNVERFETY